MSNNFLSDKVTVDNAYSLLPLYLEFVIKENDIKDLVRDYCLALCNADKKFGSNKLELSLNKFLVANTQEWVKVLSILDFSSSNSGSSIKKIQQGRLISDVLVLALRKKGIDIDCSLNLEISYKVANIIRVKGKTGTHENKDWQGVCDSLNAIRSLYTDTNKKEKDNKKSAISDDLLRLLEYIASVDTALNRVLSEEFLNNIGDIRVLERILYRDTYGDLVFTEEIIKSSKISKKCEAFIRHNFRIVENVDLSSLNIAFRKYISYWKTSMVYITSLVLKFYYKISPVYTLSCLTTLKESSKLFPIGVSVTNQNTNITRNIEFDTTVLRKRFNMLCNNEAFNNSSIIGLLMIISAVSSTKPISESALRSMIKEV